MRRYFYDLSLKWKFIVMILLITTLVAVTLGYYSLETSKTQVINKVSTSNLAVIKVIDNNLTGMQRTIADWVTVFTLSSVVQKGLQNDSADDVSLESLLYSGSNASIMDQMLVTGNFDYLALYGQASNPLYQVATDDSSGPLPLDDIRGTELYEQTVRMNGASHWFPLTATNNTFIQYNRKEKLGMSRIVRSTLTGEHLGFLFVGVNHDTIRNHYLKNMFDQDHGILVLDQDGFPLLTAGKTFYEPGLSPVSAAERLQASGSKVVKAGGEELLLTYGTMQNGWLIVYGVPLAMLTEELNSIKVFVVLILLACILLSIPLAMFISSFLTAPIKRLLVSMRRFQSGHFEEKVEVKNQDEIGLLSQGYNKMVANIKSLVDEAYVLRLKEKEAELKALQSQINPHFLYNMLDMIFWEAEKAGQETIGEMVISLSRLFRLSLNRGKSFTSLGKEKELIQHYLFLQQLRFKDKLTYRIDIPDELDRYVILNLCLQPFVENALVHGIERKREGGDVLLSGVEADGYLVFTIEDNGGGMEADRLEEITKIKTEKDVYTSSDTGGYAIQNVIQRLRHYYKDEYELQYFSEPGQGTRVTLRIPATTASAAEEEEERHVSSDDRR